MKQGINTYKYFKALAGNSSISLIVLCIICIVFSNTLNSQNQANNWYFGNGGGISFNSGSPLAFGNSALNSAEGVSSISDASGNILMYTDGLSLFNQNDVVMPNGSGLQGGNSSSQSAVIIRKPLSNNLYYLFTADQDAQPDGIRYSIVNMSLNGGLGDITATKNVLLHTPATEKLTAVMHCNKRDVWIIAHGWGDNDYMAWLLTPTGLTATPVISSVGATQDQSVIGCMKSSPDGKKLAFAVYDLGGQHYVQLCDFNPSTGSVSNPIIINTSGNCYGVEFSPNSNFLYYTGSSTSASSTINIYQVDLCAGSNAAIASSSTIAGGSSVGFIRTIQLGPDGKLYFSRFGQNSIGVIDFPNLPAPSCGFNVNGVTLSSGAICKAGLANFNQSFLKPEIPFTSNAVCLSVDFSADDIVNAASCHNPVQSINWNFGESSSGSANSSTTQNPTHSYASPGTYSVQLIVHYSCNNDTLIQSLDVNCGPQVHVNDAIVCSGSCASIQATTLGGTPPYTYLWTNGVATGSGPHSVCPLVNTQYIVTVTDASGQTDRDTASITVSSVPTPTISAQAVLCQGGNSGSASITLSGGPFTYQWVGYPALSGSTQNSLQAGTYPVIISNSNGCTRNASITVTQPLALTASISTTNTGCSLPSGTATVNASGGVSPYTYSWAGYAGTGNTLASISAGTHSVTITDANSCSITLTYTINSSSGPTLSIQELQAVSCYNGSNGSLAMNVVGGQAPYSYQWSSGQTTAQINGLSSGTYTASVTDLNGCVATASQTLMNPIALNTNVTSQSATCNLANGSASLNVSGAVSPIQIQWSTIPVQFGSVVNNLLPGNYSVLVTDGNGCSHNSSFSITNLPGAQVSSSSTSVSCFGLSDATINLSVITPDSYQVQWNTGQTGSQLNQIGAGTYTATVTTSVGCVSTVTEVISNPSPLQLSFSSISASCGSSNGSVLATVTGGTSPYSYSWAGYSGNNSNALSSILAGTYPLTVTDSHGCTISGNASVSSMNGPTILVSSQQDPQCNGAATGSASVSVSGSALPLSILWSNGTIGTSVSGLVAGNYSAVVTDANGCQSSVSLTLNQPSSITSIVSTNSTICNAANGSIQLNINGGTFPYSVNWVGPSVATGINPIGLLAGIYNANITDAHGCTASASANVGTQLPPQVSISETQSITCPGGSNAQLLAQVTNGQSPFSYLWNTGQSGSSLSNLSSGTYSVTVTDASGCTATSSHVLTAPASWNISNQISSSTCGNPNGAIQLSISGGSSPYTCSWSSGQTGTLVNQLTSGVYSAVILDNHGCSTSFSGTVNDLGGVQLSVTNQQDATCYGLANGSATLSISGGTAPYTISWPDGSQLTQRNDLAAGTYNVSVTDASSCQSSVSIVINEPAAISGSIQTTNASCGLANGTASISLSGGVAPFTYQWTNGQTASSTSALAGNIGVLVSDAQGCSQNFVSSIGSAQPIVTTISQTHTISCPGGNDGELSLQISGGVAPYTVQWSTTESSLTINTLTAGNYSVNVTDASGCTATSSHVLTAPASWNISNQITSSTCGNPNGAIQLSISGGSSPYTCTWSTGQIGTLVNQLTSGVYSATIIDNHGCSTNYSGTVNDLGGVQLSVTNQQGATCNGLANGSATLSISGGTAPYTISWPDGSQLTQRNNLAAGTYNVSVTDASSCQSSVSIVINEPAAISGTIQTTDASCGLANGTASISLSGGVAPFTYQWTNGQTASSTISVAGNIGVLVTDSQGCSQNFVSSIGSALPIIATISQTHSISCPGGNDGELSLQISGGVAPYTVQWSTGESSLAITTLSAGNYSVNVTDATGCIGSSSSQISEPSNWSVQAITSSSTCGNANGSLQLSVSGATAPYSINWSNSQTGLTANQLLAGTYTATISDALGCSTTSIYSVADAGGLQLSIISQLDAHCAGSSDGIAQVQAIGGTAPYVYQWFDGLNTTQRADLSAGTHLVTVTDANGCSASNQVVISEPSSLDGILTINDGTCGLANGSASIQANGGTLPYFYSWTNSSVLPTINGLSNGSIGVLVTDANGCQRNFIRTVGMAPALQLSATVLQSISCFGGSNGEVQLNGGSNLLVNWSNGQIGMNLQNVSAGSYTAIAVDAGGCSDTITVSLTEPAALSGQIITHDATCLLADGDASLQVTGGTLPYAYSWSNGASLSTVSSLSAGVISVQISDANGCQITLSGTISSQQNLQIQSIQVIDASCAGLSDGSANATISGAVGNVTWNWSNGSTNQQAGNLSAGSYQVEVSDAAGCSVAQNFTIQQPIFLSAFVDKIDVSCHALSDGQAYVQVSGGTQPYSYLWDGLLGLDSTNQFFAGSHQVFVTDQHGCTVQVDFIIDQPEQLLLEIQTTPSVCGLPNGSMIGLAQGGTAPYHYSWSTGENLSQIAGLTSGAYTLSVNDSHGCTSTITKSFQDPGAPEVSLIHAQDIACYGGADGSIEVSTQGGTGMLHLNWMNLNSASDSLDGLSSGSYTVLVSDELNCKDTLTIELTQPDALAISHSSIDVRCFDGSDGSIQLNLTGGTQPYTYLWSGTNNAFVAQESINQLSADAYHVMVIDAHLCQIEDTIQINQPELLSTIFHSIPTRCFGEASGEIISQTNGGTLPYTFQWSTGDQSAAIDSLLAGNYQLSVSDAHGCEFSVQAQVLQPDALIASIGGTKMLCKGDSALLIASASGGTSPFSYQWSAGVSHDHYTWYAIETHIEQVIVQDSKGCIDTISNELLVYELPNAEVVSAQTSICAGTCVDFSAAPVNGGNYVWSDSQNRIHTGQTVSFCYDDATTVGMSLQVTDNHGCENRWTANSYLTVHPLPEIGFEPDHFTIPLLQALVHFENTTTGALSYIWDFDPRTNGLISNDISPSYQYTEIGDYPVTLIATNEFGCSAQLQRTITVTEDFAVYFPSAFTPNSDGLNDRFLPSGVGILSEGFNMQIYNRWGNLVYETKNLGQGWDGSYASKEGDVDAASEVFIWQVSLTDFTGLVREYRGSVTLIR